MTTVKQPESPTKGLVISSLTGKPMNVPHPAARAIPDRAPADEGNDSNDDRLTRDIPPHWGK